MNCVRYSEKYDVFITSQDESIQLSGMDMVVMKRIICGYAVFRVLFGHTSLSNPLFKIKSETINGVTQENKLPQMIENPVVGTLKLYENPRYCGYFNGKEWIAKCKTKEELIEWYEGLAKRPNDVTFLDTVND